MVSQSFKNDLNKVQKETTNSKKNFVVVRLTKAGVPNKMADATQRFYNEREALEYVSRVRTLNPKQAMRFTLNGLEI